MSSRKCHCRDSHYCHVNPCPTTAAHFLRQVSLFKATGKTKDDSNKPFRDFSNEAVPSWIEKIANVYVFRCLRENSLRLYWYLFFLYVSIRLAACRISQTPPRRRLFDSSQLLAIVMQAFHWLERDASIHHAVVALISRARPSPAAHFTWRKNCTAVVGNVSRLAVVGQGLSQYFWPWLSEWGSFLLYSIWKITSIFSSPMSKILTISLVKPLMNPRWKAKPHIKIIWYLNQWPWAFFQLVFSNQN